MRAGEEGGDRDLVGGIEHGRRGAARVQRVGGKPDARKARVIRRART